MKAYVIVTTAPISLQGIGQHQDMVNINATHNQLLCLPKDKIFNKKLCVTEKKKKKE